MEDKCFVFTEDMTIRMIQLRFANEALFKSKGQPWEGFRNLLLENGFPPELTVCQLRKRWGYLFDAYKVAKSKGKVRKFRFHKYFEKHYGKHNILDKYESWPDSWRLKLAICVTEAKDQLNNSPSDQKAMWSVVERAMRMQNLPEDCCIQDIKGLWHHILVTFRRQYRMFSRQGKRRRPRSGNWPLYDTILEYYKRHEKQHLLELQTEGHSKYRKNPRKLLEIDENNEFHWSTDITESFLQLRLQNDHMFYGKGQPWSEFTLKVLREEHGFPSTLAPRAACKKWQQAFADYQKAKATNNTSWHYYDIFESYLGEGSLSLNPLLDWEEKWVVRLIEARAKHEECFRNTAHRTLSQSWREVEKELRRNGIPLECSLLELPLYWAYLTKMYKWKRKFANKGVLKEQWPYFDVMTKCMDIIDKDICSKRIRRNKNYSTDYDDRGIVDDDDDDDIKLFDLKQKMEIEVKPNVVVGGKQCRACADVGECIDVFQHVDEEGVDVATKLLIICGIQVEKAQSLPTQICNTCLEELENAYKFRRRCQTVNDQFCDYTKNVKIESHDLNYENMDTGNDDHDMTFDMEQTEKVEMGIDKIENQITKVKAPKIVAKNVPKPTKNRQKKPIKRYYKICEICGLYTSNLKSHIDVHNAGNSYKCAECGKDFKFRNTLIMHLARHRPDYVAKTVTCEVCGKKIPTTAHYKRHMAYHNNERKFACDTCDKRFNDADILRVHKLIHTDERPFSCTECGKTFRTSGCVSRHKRIVHKIMRKVK